MVEHFAAQVQGEIGGKAKAMIVTRSRLHAVRYKLAVDEYLAERGYPFKALVAFSGTVQDGGQVATPRAGMNGFPEAQTAEDLRAARVPLPDRRQQVPDRLRPAAAAHDVRGQEARRRERGADALAAQPHAPREEGHDGARLRQRGRRDQGGLRALLRDDAPLRGDRPEPALRDPDAARRASRSTPQADVDAFARVYFDPKATQDQLYAVLAPVVERFRELSAGRAARLPRRSSPTTCGSTPSSRRCSPSPTPTSRSSTSSRGTCGGSCPPTGTSCRARCSRTSTWSPTGSSRRGSGKIALERKPGVLEPAAHQGAAQRATPEELETLSRIIAELNERFGLNLGPEHRVTLGQMMEKLDDDAALDAARGSTRGRTCASPSTRRSSTSSRRSSTRTSTSTSASPTIGPSARSKNFLFDQYLRSRGAKG